MLHYPIGELIESTKSTVIFAHSDFMGHFLKGKLVNALMALPKDDEVKMALAKHVPLFDDIHARLRRPSPVAITSADMDAVLDMLHWCTDLLQKHSDHPLASLVQQLRLAGLALLKLFVLVATAHHCYPM